jgi:DNA-binding transcriptional LysR family regulator
VTIASLIWWKRESIWQFGLVNCQIDSLISHRIGMTRRITVGAIEYFARWGEPQRRADLANHQCIVFTPLTTGNEWRFQSPQGELKVIVQGKFRTNNSIAIREAVLAGLGVAVSPIWLFGDGMNQNLLKVVLHDYQPMTLAIHAVYRRGRFQSAKVHSLIDFLREEFKIDPWVSDYGQSL